MKRLIGLAVLILGLAGCGTSAPVKMADNSNMTLFIRGSRWGLYVGTKDELLNFVGDYGITDCTNRAIFIINGLGYANQRDVIFHEMLHAGTCDENGKTHNMFYNSSNVNDHEGIYKIADYVTSTFVANPELAKYFSGQ